ncbi:MULTISPECIES: class I SAM-dependent methyltransferase [unclassified Lentimonas]|uniref:class I SAM-dependent methyltransferase n=1 Tax=unclassified Lentimonas TaxID=2630993 RepID=UPI001327BE48|nr:MULTISPECIES: class I SAM-dependent methyltransferase [unclassified Lentimonas]CAA6678346.1 SAM-dependent methyltransferase (EC [Lentimonas sp. CC4]CAA6685438.1 SAM-dependent methyltransferase (EC [Lentimonas sp. CC6]CAA7076886.1 SAM-dependent methyltransferase (EC [Lentimonas sp. CC4]CAA7170716.1 SAM-dependent methyltransferase (EC [Lentimonas sp. CC21]CAA7179722.1 SAM-dependent methyltransferase (EC [Lentimonas sp. CC8]
MSLSSIVFLNTDSLPHVQQLGERLALRCVDGTSICDAKAKHVQRFLMNQCPGDDFVFVYGADGLTLHAVGPDHSVNIRADFHGATVTYRRKQGGGKGQMIAKAVGVRGGVHPHVLDATAGLGGDGFVLSSLGCRVTLLERVPAVRALLEDGLLQARAFAATEDAELQEVLERMELIEADSLNYLNTIPADQQPDVVYLDPMFPVRSKSAMVKKEMRVFHSLVGTDPDADGLLDAALSCARYRVVVKRPRIAPQLAGPAPSHVLEGKSNRYDVYTIAKLPDGLNAPLL